MTEKAQAALRPRQAIERMHPYVPPTAGRYGRERFDFNENTVGCSPRVIETLQRLATPDFLATYPEYGDARERVAAFFGVPPGQLLFSAGTDEAIHVLIQTYVEPGDEVVMPWPTYPMFRFYAQVAGAEPKLVHYQEPSLAFPFEELFDAITPRTRAILIANPNNPTGGAIDLESVERILQAAPQAALLIDEAYFEFFGVTALPLIESYPNLFVSRTFSKVYGLAALRVGCLLSRAENVALLHKGQSPYSVNALGPLCAAAAVEDQDYIRAYVAEASASRSALARALDEWGVPHYPSQANFILARFGDEAGRVCQQMRERGFLLRDRRKELAGAVRITVGPREQTERLINALGEVLGR